MKRIAASLIFLAAASAHADGDFYVVGSLGNAGINKTAIQVSQNNRVNSITTPLPNTISTSSKTSALNSTEDTKNGAFKLQLGYEFTPNFAVEGGYVDLGKASYSAAYTSTPYLTVNGVTLPGIPSTPKRLSADSTARFSGWNIVGVGIYPLNDAFSLFAKFGLIDAKTKAQGSLGENTSTKWKATWGLGANYRATQKVGVRVEYERFVRVGEAQTTGTSDIGLMSVGVSSKF